MGEKIYLYLKWVRLWHWSNAILCLLLILTGVSMHYANPDGGFISFETAVSIHNVCGFLLSAFYVFYFIGNLLTGNGKYYRIERRGYFKMLLAQSKYYLFGVFKKEKRPFPVSMQRKFNPLQKLTYVIIMYICVPLIIITGLGLFFPETIIDEYFGVSGFLLTDFIHIATGFAVSIFLIIHLYMATMGDKVTSDYKAMITGYHDH